MSNLYDILKQIDSEKNVVGDVSKKVVEVKNKGKGDFNKQGYVEEVKQLKGVLYDTIKSQAQMVAISPQDFLKCLELEARLGYTASNTLLIKAQNPNATKLKDSKHWNEENVYINKGEKGIYILEPSKQFVRKDGSIGTSFIPKKVFDIKQTNAKVEEIEKYTYLELLSAVVYESDIPIELIHSDSNIPRNVFYYENENKIYVKDGMDENEQLIGLIRELNLAHFKRGERDTRDVGFIVQSATYMTIIKYGITSDDNEFIKDSIEFFNGKNDKEIKHNLNEIKTLFNKFDDGMSKRLREVYDKKKSIKKSEIGYER